MAGKRKQQSPISNSKFEGLYQRHTISTMTDKTGDSHNNSSSVKLSVENHIRPLKTIPSAERES